jgi:PLP dependent protein
MPPRTHTREKSAAPKSRKVSAASPSKPAPKRPATKTPAQAPPTAPPASRPLAKPITKVIAQMRPAGVVKPAPAPPRRAAPLPPKAPAILEKVAMPESLADRYALVQAQIARAAERSGRSAKDVMLVAVTKNAEPEQIKSLLQLGHRDFGENRAQVLVQHAAVVDEFLARQRLLPSAARPTGAVPARLFDAPAPRGLSVAGAHSQDVRWHMIGHLQRNKAKKVIEFVRLVHSLDSLRLAEELQAIAVKKDRVIEVLLQVNCSGEEQKYGCPFPAAIRLAEQIGTMVNIRLRGLMTMAAYSEKPEEARPAFARCRELFQEMRTMNFTEGPFNILSMGMSGDYEVAISEGSNIVRVGSAIFGESSAPRPDELPEHDEE